MPEGLNDESNDSPTNYEEIVMQRHLQEIAYDNFKLWLNNFYNCKIYTINGNAGTGMTTFINFLRYDLKRKLDIKVDIKHDLLK